MENNCFVEIVVQFIMNSVPLEYIDWKRMVDAVYEIQRDLNEKFATTDRYEKRSRKWSKENGNLAVQKNIQDRHFERIQKRAQ